MKSRFVPEKSLFLAPMEGITDPIYREVISRLYPEWDFMACDFLRLPGAGKYPRKHFIEHIGPLTFHNPNLLNKTIYQVLTSESGNIEDSISQLQDLGVPWVDLNLGCPSKTVIKNKGGSYLLSDLRALEKVLTRIRNLFKGRFTAKIRIGLESDEFFLPILSVIENSGVEAITLHARTRVQMYKGVADWSYIAKATQHSGLPIIGNGDIWSLADIEKVYQQTGCHSVMLARSAMKSPWLAKEFKLERELTLNEKKRELNQYFVQLFEGYAPILGPEKTLKRLKALCRYIFDHFPNGEVIKRQNLREHEPELFFSRLDQLECS